MGHSVEGCPDGHLHISEGKAGSAPPPGSGSGSGVWCGSVSNNIRHNVTLSSNFMTFGFNNGETYLFVSTI